MTTKTQVPTASGGGHIDPAASLVSGTVPVQTRSERPTSFDPDDFGAPSGREVNWKHTPIDRLGAVLDAHAVDSGTTPAVAVSAEGDEQSPLGLLAVGEAPRGEFFRPEDLPAAIAWTRSEHAVSLTIPEEKVLDAPVVVTLHGSGVDRVGHQHLVIEARANSKATIVLRHEGSAHYAQNVEIIVRDGADLTVASVQRWDDDAVHVASHQARVDRDAQLTHFVVTLGGGVVRVNPSVELAGAGSQGRLFGLSFADAGQHLESQVYLHHKGPHTKGDVLYKGALQGESAHSVWIGDVLIGHEAVGTDSYEANRNLVLTDGARADSIPNLEIETGDIQGAGHASATGRFDDEQLFYLQARGIAEDEARRLVVLGFLSEIVQRIGVPDLEAELTQAIERELAEGASA